LILGNPSSYLGNKENELLNTTMGGCDTFQLYDFSSALIVFSDFVFTTDNSNFLGQLYIEKIPEIEKSLALVHYLKQKRDAEEELITRYNLADMLYSRAEVDVSSGIVHLWLGANVMLEYTYDEAIDLLSSKEKAAKMELDHATQDLAFTRNQIITTEVNISRIYNWDVRQKRAAKKDSLGEKEATN